MKSIYALRMFFVESHSVSFENKENALCVNINMIASLSIVRTGFPKAAKVRKFAKIRRQTLTLVKVSSKTGKVILRFTVGFIEVNEKMLSCS